MQSLVEGVLVGVEDERWTGKDGKAGRRVAVYVQQSRDGDAAPTKISLATDDHNSASGLGFGVLVRVPVTVRAWSENGIGKLILTSIGPIASAAPANK